MKYRTLFFFQSMLFLTISIIVHGLSRSELKSRMKRLKKRLEIKDFPWTKKQLSGYLLKTKHLAKKGIINEGALSEQAVQRQLYKGVLGKDVSLYIFGESVSVGADLGKFNKEKVFHNLLAFWWDTLFRNVTESRMLRKNIAVGGVGSSYFGRCWQEYLRPEDNIDLAIWEFNINDVGENCALIASLERFTQSLYARFKKLNLVFNVFFRRTFFYPKKRRDEMSSKRHELEENLVAAHAYKHNLTCFNVEPLVNYSKVPLGLSDMFRNIHPSALAHTQMAFLMIDYYTDVLSRALDKWIEIGFPKESESFNLPIPKSFQKASKKCPKTTCWTAVTPNYKRNIQEHNLFKLPARLSKNVESIKSGWKGIPETRYDITGGYRANGRGARVSIYFDVWGAKGRPEQELSLALRYSSQSIDSITLVKLERVNLKKKTVQQYYSTSIKALKKDNGLRVHSIVDLPRGIWKITVQVKRGGFLLCSLIIS